MKLFIASVIAAALLALAVRAEGAEPCVQQDYSQSEKKPRWDCAGPDEDILLPDIRFRPSVGLDRGASFRKSDQTGLIKLDYPTVLMDKDKVIQLGLRIQGLRRLRWLDLHRGAKILEVESKYVGSVLQSKIELEKSRVTALRGQRDDARRQRDEAKKWYRSWTFGLVVGIVVTTAAAGTIAYIAR
jgi:hypothetical protein